MFDFLKKKPKPGPTPYEQLRGAILANEELKVVASRAAGDEQKNSPWALFAQARQAADKTEAQEHLQRILQSPDLEARVYAQAWQCLRQLGVSPDSTTAAEVYGIVVEVGLNAGLDSVAAYSDHSARYFNHSGAAVIWETETAEMNQRIDACLEVAEFVRSRTEPGDGPHPAPPGEGMMLVNVLTPAGIHFGAGPMDTMQTDPMGAAVTQSALDLMQALMKQSKDG